MRRRRGSSEAILLTVLLALAGGCRSDFTRQDQEKLQQLYYSGNLDRAAELSMKMSDAEKGETGREALLWHLEAGSINLDAGRFDEALTALERAEKLFWLFDRQGRIHLHRPGTATYHGYRNDRLVLGMLKFFTYFSRGELEDALVEIRRLRAGQYLYLLKESDPNLREYDQENFGRKVAPYRLRKLEKENQTAAGAFHAAGVNAEYGEYKDRLRPRLALLFNPLPFYLSALGYYWDNQFDEAAIDLKYLYWLQPDNELFRRDYATVLHLLGEKTPPELASVKPWDYSLTDNLAVVILAQGVPPGWMERSATVRLPGMVPGYWKFNLPENTRAQALTLRASGGGRRCVGSELADLTGITQDEFWQLTMPELAGGAAAAIRSKTIEHEAGLAELRRQGAGGRGGGGAGCRHLERFDQRHRLAALGDDRAALPNPPPADSGGPKDHRGGRRSGPEESLPENPEIRTGNHPGADLHPGGGRKILPETVEYDGVKL